MEVRGTTVQTDADKGGVKMTTESSKNGTITLSRVNFSRYVKHATIFSWMLTTACCLLAALGKG